MLRFTASVTTLICLVLFALLLVSPASYLMTYGVAVDEGGAFMVRRASPMFLGFAIILWMSRNAAPSPIRTAICYGVTAAFAGVAMTGIAAYLTGGASAMILVAAAGEVVLAALFWRSRG